MPGAARPFTVLVGVMRQTSSYAGARKGRCSVFWGDQVFVPSCGIASSTAPADILAALRPMPTKAEWEAAALHQYGLRAVAAAGRAYDAVVVWRFDVQPLDAVTAWPVRGGAVSMPFREAALRAFPERSRPRRPAR